MCGKYLAVTYASGAGHHVIPLSIPVHIFLCERDNTLIMEFHFLSASHAEKGHPQSSRSLGSEVPDYQPLDNIWSPEWMAVKGTCSGMVWKAGHSIYKTTKVIIIKRTFGRILNFSQF